MRIADRGTVFRDHPGGEQQSAAFPGVAVLPGGRWFCSFRTAQRKDDSGGRWCITWSDDEGKTWSQPTEPFRSDHD